MIVELKIKEAKIIEIPFKDAVRMVFRKHW